MHKNCNSKCPSRILIRNCRFLKAPVTLPRPEQIKPGSLQPDKMSLVPSHYSGFSKRISARKERVRHEGAFRARSGLLSSFILFLSPSILPVVYEAPTGERITQVSGPRDRETVCAYGGKAGGGVRVIARTGRDLSRSHFCVLYTYTRQRLQVLINTADVMRIR